MEVETKRANEDYVVMAEYRLLNALIHDEIFLQDSRIHDNSFPHELAKSFYKAITDMHALKIPITAAALHQRANELDFNASLEVSNQIISIDKGSTTIDNMLDVLFKAVKKQNIIEKLNAASSTATNKGEIATEELMTMLMELEDLVADTGDSVMLKDLDMWMADYIEDFKERANGREYRFGCPLLDKALVKGAYPGAITTVAGATGQGKSAYVLNLINGMINQDIPCMYLSLEMSDIDTMDRMMSMRCDIPTSDLYHPGGDTESFLGIFEKEREKLKKSKLFYFVDDPDISLAQLSGLIKEFKQRTRSDYVVVAVDLLTQVRDFMESGKGMNLAQGMERAMNKLNIVAKKENCHFIAVVQFNRDADNTKVQTVDDIAMLRPSLNNIKNAHAIAERSRAVLGIFRPKYYVDRYLDIENDEEAKAEYDRDTMEVQVLKQSNGATPKIEYEFIGEVFRTVPLMGEGPESPEEKKVREAQSHINY